MLQIKQFTFSPMAENTYVLYNENKQACIIDPGCYFSAEKSQLEAFVTEMGLKVEYLLLTHAHLDHVFGLKWAADTYGLKPCLHENELKVLERGPVMASMYGMPFPAYEGMVSLIAAEDQVIIGQDVLQVIFAPGHSPGHVCYYCAAQGFIIGGDVLFQRSIGRTDLPGGDHQTLLNSIRTQLFVLPDVTFVYSGHGPSTTIGEEKRFNPFLN
jgi:glyoxylase-like metal-dependent hydrolase (beta-lactamase superfamily II)